METGFIDSVFSTLHWSTMTINKHHRSYNRRSNAACALVKSTYDKQTVALTGGANEFGLDLVEILEFDNSTTWLKISERLPDELNQSTGLTFSQLLSINKGTELLLYGGQIGNQIFDGIYKFDFASKTWLQVGKMKFSRSAHVVIPVDALTCSNSAFNF